MTPAAAKKKGMDFQKEIRDLILKHFTELTARDVKSTSSGADGEDILLSERAYEALNHIVIECKSLNKLETHNVYAAIKQCQGHGEGRLHAAFMRTNHKGPLVVLEAEEFIKFMRSLTK